MNEYTVGYLFTFSMVGLTVGSWLYWLGGRSNKWLRRILGSLVIAVTVNITSCVMGVFNWWFMLIYPALILGFSMGYGASVPLMKAIKRTIYALCVIGAGLIFCLTIGGKCWLVFIPHLGIGLWSVYLGVINPIDAPAEEGFICVILNLGLIMYPFIK